MRTPPSFAAWTARRLPLPPMWRVAAPGFTLPNGTYVPPCERLVYFDPTRSGIADLLSAAGVDCWQRRAQAELAAMPGWSSMPLRERVLCVLARATDIRQAEVRDPRVWPAGERHPILTAPVLPLV